MLSNRRASIAPVPSDPRADPHARVSVCNPRPAWRRTSSSFHPTTTAAAAAAASPDAAPPPRCATPSVPTSTTPSVPGYAVRRSLGVVHGTTTGAPPPPHRDGPARAWLRAAGGAGAGAGAGAGVGVGVEVRGLTALLYDLREVAVERMVADCVARGGNAVVGLRVAEGEVMGCVTVSAQGTAVFVEPAGKGAGGGGGDDPFRGS